MALKISQGYIKEKRLFQNWLNMCAMCNWEEVLDMAEEMLEEDKFRFAEKTLKGIADWVSDNEHVTDAQENAVNNILNSKGL